MTELNAQTGKELFTNLHWGQTQAWRSTARYTLVLAGTQSGKTSFGPTWVEREIANTGPGDGLVVAPTFPMLNLKLLPEFRALFEDKMAYGKYVSAPYHRFEFSNFGLRKMFGTVAVKKTRVLFAHATDPDAVESATAGWAWLDEAGQKKFKSETHNAILRRLSLARGRVLYTSTPYYLGWLKTEVYDRAIAGDPDYALINFRSIDNPAFSKAEYLERKAKLPEWKFNMMYNGQFERPAGVIYDCVDNKNFVPAFRVPEHWPRFLGLDFGGINTAAVAIAQNPNTNEFFLYGEYLAGNRTAAEHVARLLRNMPTQPHAVGGAKSEDNYRREYAAAGLGVLAPSVHEVEIGIGHVYGLLKTKQLKIMDNVAGVRDELSSYSRVLDANDQPTDAIEDKASYHRLDALRYIGSWLALNATTSAGVPVASKIVR